MKSLRFNRPATPFTLILALKVALDSGDKAQRLRASEDASQFIKNYCDNAFTVPTPEENLAWNLANLDLQNCSREMRHTRRKHLLDTYFREHYTESKAQELGMALLRGILMALGAVVVFGFLASLITG